MPKAVKHEDLSPGDMLDFLPVSEYVPVHDGGAENPLFVWAVYRSPQFHRDWKAGLVQYHASLGWQPAGGRSWDWEVAQWMYLPRLPEWARRENIEAGYPEEGGR
ncbi:hypothetical protein F6X40_24155 [Paraburkholderia sp. UCT31]|uniref:hypothetical protein n=1 Tax=Paraburkholderia sp. UCT31 TaxID=2615209 RepID=UPI0016562773|nr:hypothetical protein [Paraburkholderia sp. UCT31]MBC8739811.1 hypothetical protein [Paraburkholderia sp. UCT31]